MKAIIFPVMAAAVMLFTPVHAQDGASLYKQNCAVCHNAVGKGKLVGPDLKGSTEKYEEPWLMKWIKSSQTLVKENDPIAVKVFNENNKMVMPDQALPEADIKAIIGYIKEESARLDQPVASTPPPANTTTEAKNAAPDSPVIPGNVSSPVSGSITVWFLFGLSCVLLIIIVIMGNIIKGLSESLRKEA